MSSKLRIWIFMNHHHFVSPLKRDCNLRNTSSLHAKGNYELYYIEEGIPFSFPNFPPHQHHSEFQLIL